MHKYAKNIFEGILVAPTRDSLEGIPWKAVSIRSRIKFVIHFMYMDCCTWILFKKCKTTHGKLMSSSPVRMTLLGNTISKF
jgi:hypothetical protein